MLDRLVGYKASPVLWKTVKKGLSAGRVQTVALRLIVEREREIRAFKPVEYWTVEALLEKDGQQFTAKLHQIDGKKAEIRNEAEAERDSRRPRRRAKTFDGHRGQAPRAPQESGGAVHDAHAAAGSGEEAVGSAPSARCASRRISTRASRSATRARSVSSRTCVRTRRASRESAATQARDYLRTLFGEEYLAQGAAALRRAARRRTRRTRTRAIRPTDPTRRPDDIRQVSDAPTSSSSTSSIWQRFMASQMAPAVFDTTTVDFDIPATSSRRSAVAATCSAPPAAS